AKAGRLAFPQLNAHEILPAELRRDCRRDFAVIGIAVALDFLPALVKDNHADGLGIACDSEGKPILIARVKTDADDLAFIRLERAGPDPVTQFEAVVRERARKFQGETMGIDVVVRRAK